MADGHHADDEYEMIEIDEDDESEDDYEEETTEADADFSRLDRSLHRNNLKSLQFVGLDLDLPREPELKKMTKKKWVTVKVTIKKK